MWTPRQQGCGHHRRGERHRPRERQSASPRRARGGRRRPRRRRGHRGRRARSRALRPGRRGRRDSVEAHVRRGARSTAGIDIFFNNAGISPPEDDSILDDRPRRLAAGPGRQPDVRLPLLPVRHPAPAERGGGSIINTASFVAVLGSATSQISYTASKGGVLSMSRELGVQFARERIRVNALCPGPVNTPLLRELFAKDPERAARRLVHVPMGRFAEPEEIAARPFLASDDSSFITATTFLVDGGIHGAYVTPL